MPPEGAQLFRRYISQSAISRIESATRFVIDSEIGDYVRVLHSSLLEPVEPAPSLSGLTRWELWSEEEEAVLPKQEAASMVGVEPQFLQERRVFIRVGNRTFEATQLVRLRAKQTYSRVLRREANLRALRERR